MKSKLFKKSLFLSIFFVSGFLASCNSNDIPIIEHSNIESLSLSYFGSTRLVEHSSIDLDIIVNGKIDNENKFVDYIITYSGHMPFTTEKGLCKSLITEDLLKEQGIEELSKDQVLPNLTEEECARRQAKETDYMVELLINTLQEKMRLDDTVIVVFTDHY